MSYFQDYYEVLIDMKGPKDNIVSGIFNTMNRVYVPSLKECKAWGDLNPPNPRSQDMIAYYVSKIKLFVDYLESEYGAYTRL